MYPTNSDWVSKAWYFLFLCVVDTHTHTVVYRVGKSKYWVMDKHIAGFCLFVEFVNSKINVDQCQSYNYILARVEQLVKQHSVQIIICIMFNILHISVVSQYFKTYSPLLWCFNFQGLRLVSSLLTHWGTMRNTDTTGETSLGPPIHYHQNRAVC